MLINKRQRKQAVLLATTSVFAFTAVFSGVGSAYAEVKSVTAVATVRLTSNIAASETIVGTPGAPVAIELIGGGTIVNAGTIRGQANASAIVVTGVLWAVQRDVRPAAAFAGTVAITFSVFVSITETELLS